MRPDSLPESVTNFMVTCVEAPIHKYNAYLAQVIQSIDNDIQAQTRTKNSLCPHCERRGLLQLDCDVEIDERLDTYSFATFIDGDLRFRDNNKFPIDVRVVGKCIGCRKEIQPASVFKFDIIPSGYKYERDMFRTHSYLQYGEFDTVFPDDINAALDVVLYRLGIVKEEDIRQSTIDAVSRLRCSHCQVRHTMFETVCSHCGAALK